MISRYFFWALALVAWVATYSCHDCQAADDRAVVRPVDNGAVLANPGMGWVFHYYDNQPNNYGSKLAASDTLDAWPGLTVIYLRIPWSYIEPEEGRFNWSVLDTPAQRWIAKGKQVAFRITASESWTRWAIGAPGDDMLSSRIGRVPKLAMTWHGTRHN